MRLCLSDSPSITHTQLKGSDYNTIFLSLKMFIRTLLRTKYFVTENFIQ